MGPSSYGSIARGGMRNWRTYGQPPPQARCRAPRADDLMGMDALVVGVLKYEGRCFLLGDDRASLRVGESVSGGGGMAAKEPVEREAVPEGLRSVDVYALAFLLLWWTSIGPGWMPRPRRSFATGTDTERARRVCCAGSRTAAHSRTAAQLLQRAR